MTQAARFGAALLRFRKGLRWTRKQMADMAQVHPGSYAGWENGRSFPRYEEKRDELRKLFGLTEADLPMTDIVRDSKLKVKYISPTVGRRASHDFPGHEARVRYLARLARREKPLAPERRTA